MLSLICPKTKSTTVLRLVALLFCVNAMVSVTTSARAFAKGGSDIGVRANFSLGPWISKFSQTDGSHQVKITTAPSAGMGLGFGIQVWPFFVEYNLAWMLSAYSYSPKSRDASYFTPMGLNLGLSLPILPLEVYVGGERGSYKLNGGVNPDYGGNTLKAGVNLAFSIGGNEHANVGLKAEFRRIFVTSDERGDMPEGITTQSDMYFIGMFFGAR